MIESNKRTGIKSRFTLLLHLRRSKVTGNQKAEKGLYKRVVREKKLLV